MTAARYAAPMRREHGQLHSPAIGRSLDVLAIGHAGQPMLVFPSSEGSFHEYADRGMVAAIAHHINAGRLRLYCVSSYDSESWYGRHLPIHERAFRHSLYEDWIMNQVVPFIARDADVPGAGSGAGAGAWLWTTGCSFGAFHAANFALKNPRTFSQAICMSGVYNIRFLMHGHHDDWVYFNNPMEYVTHMHGDALADVCKYTNILLLCGQGLWEDTCLASTKEFWWLLGQKGIPNYMDLWGHDVAHDWPWWVRQNAHVMNALITLQQSSSIANMSARKLV